MIRGTNLEYSISANKACNKDVTKQEKPRQNVALEEEPQNDRALEHQCR